MSSITSIRTSVLAEAEQAVNGDRNVDYGDPNKDFTNTARLWNGYLNLPPHFAIESHDVAMLMILLKISRSTHNPNKRDTWVDIAGYAACGADCIDKNTTDGLT